MKATYRQDGQSDADRIGDLFALNSLDDGADGQYGADQLQDLPAAFVPRYCCLCSNCAPLSLHSD
jgi:hypothetical protein